MDGWIKVRHLFPIDQSELPVQTARLISPYEIPDAIRIGEASPGRVRMDFRYIDGEEKGRVHELAGKVVIVEGCYSGRLLSIEVPVTERISTAKHNIYADRESAAKSKLHSLMVAVEDLLATAKEKVENHASVRNAISSRETDLVFELVGTT